MLRVFPSSQLSFRAAPAKWRDHRLRESGDRGLGRQRPQLRAIDAHANFVLLNPLRPVSEVFGHIGKNDVHVAP